MSTLHLIVFSRNRPLQLHGYLTSLFQHVEDPEALRVDVLARVEAPYDAAYRAVRDEFVGRVAITERQDFATDLRRCLATANEPLMAFGVDDAVFVAPFSVNRVAAAFRDDEPLGVSLRLGRNVVRSMFHGPVSQPTLQPNSDWLTWNATAPDAVGDWGYPWEIDGTAYQTAFVESVVEALVESGHCTSPNQLEHYGAQRWPVYTNRRRLWAYPTSRLVVPTVNVIQHDFANGIVGAPGLTPEFLLTCWDAGLRMDTERFAQQLYDSVHVADFFLRRAG